MEDTIVWGMQKQVETPDGRIMLNVHSPAEHRQPRANIVMLHGLGGNRHEHNGIFARCAASLAVNGFNAVRFDFRGNGESDHESEFMSLQSMIEDVSIVIDDVKKNGTDKTYLLGLSLGGLIAAFYTSINENIEALCLWEPPYHLMKTLRRLYGHLSLDRIRARGYFAAGMLKLSENFVKEYDELDMDKNVESIKCPVYLIQGEEDPIVLPEDAHKWSEGFSRCGIKYETIYIPGADHAFSQEEHALRVIDLTVDWFNQIDPVSTR